MLRHLKTQENDKEKVLSKYSMHSALEKHLYKQEIGSAFSTIAESRELCTVG